VPAAWPDLPDEYDLPLIEALAALDRDRYDSPTMVVGDPTPVAATEADR
jgi:hypothetical protein